MGTLILCAAVAVPLLAVLAAVHLRTRHALGQVMLYQPISCAPFRTPWYVQVERNGFIFVKIRDHVTGLTLDVFRWELSRG